MPDDKRDIVAIIDIDDVQMPWLDTVHKACVEAGLTSLDTEITQWETWVDYGCSKEEWLAVVDSLVVPNGLYQTPPYPGVVDAVHKLFYAGVDVWFVTARGFFAHADQIRQWTREWVREYYGPHPFNLVFSKQKGEVATAIGATHAIDDSMKNVLELRDVGVDTYLMNQSHNRAFQYPDDRRVNSVPEFVEKVLNG